MRNKDGIEEDVVALIESDDIQGAAAELAEAGLDQLLAEGFLRDVPILGTVLGVIRTAGAVRDLLLAKKLGLFLRALQSVPVNERKHFHDSLGTQVERRKTGEALLLLLDRLDDMDKPELVGRVFRAFIRGDVEGDALRQMAASVDRLFITHLPHLMRFYRERKEQAGQAFDPDILQALSFAGLVRVEAQTSGGIGGAEFVRTSISFEPNDFGRRFVEVISRDA